MHLKNKIFSECLSSGKTCFEGSGSVCSINTSFKRALRTESNNTKISPQFSIIGLDTDAEN